MASSRRKSAATSSSFAASTSTSPARCRRPKQRADFLADKSADKRDQLVDRLLDTPEYAFYFANKWADILRVKRGNNQQNRAYGTFSFHNWIRDAMASDKPYDEFARDILAAVGDESKSPPTVWYKDLPTADLFVDNASQVFLGTRMQCAQCHHHPYEKWSQDDYWGLAAFFGRVGHQADSDARHRQPEPAEPEARDLHQVARAAWSTSAPARPPIMKPLGGEPMDPDGDLDPRQKLVDWLAEPNNPFFARAVANRYWAHFFGRGIVDPLDDMRVTNPPSNPELLDALAKDLVDSKFSLKHLIRTICKSRTYSLSSTPNEFNKNDKQAYSRYYPKRMSAEVLFDAVCQVTASPTAFAGLPQDKHAPNRAIMLPDESFQSYFLDVFGRPQRISACECERVSEANLAQALHLLNSEEVQGKIARQGGRADAPGQGPAPRRREGRGAVPLGPGPQAEREAPATRPRQHRGQHQEQEDRLREHSLGAVEYEGIRVQSVMQMKPRRSRSGLRARSVSDGLHECPSSTPNLLRHVAFLNRQRRQSTRQFFLVSERQTWQPPAPAWALF